MDIWPWISELPGSDEWDRGRSEVITFQLAPSAQTSASARSIQLRAERRQLDSSSQVLLTFSVCFVGFESLDPDNPVWSSDTCSLSSGKPFLPLVLQLLEEIVSRSPNAHGGSCPRSQLQKLKPDPVSWILDSHSTESFSSFFDLVFLTRLFWLCVFDAPSEIGSFYFQSVLAPNLETLSCKYAPVLKKFLFAVGTDVELCLMRTFGYILAKWMILREIEFGLQSLAPLPNLGFSYAMESHGLWILKGYSPVKSLQCVQCHREKRQFRDVVSAKESFLKYALAHQQLEAVIQLEYTVRYFDNYIQVNARVDNLRFHVVKLGFRNDSNEECFLEEKHFPSRVRVWVGPEIGAGYVGGLSLGRSTDNVEREMEVQKTLKGKSGNVKIPKVKATARIATRTKIKNWRWDQDVEGNAAIFDAILCDNTGGAEVATWKPPVGGGRAGNNLTSRYAGGNRPFTKSGGLVFAGEEYGQAVGWRLSKEMEGSVLPWRVGGRVWLSYWPNDVNSSFYETRCVEWCDEVDLPLIPYINN